MSSFGSVSIVNQRPRGLLCYSDDRVVCSVLYPLPGVSILKKLHATSRSFPHEDIRKASETANHFSD